MLFHVADLHFLRMERDAELRGDAALLADAAEMKARELALIEAADCTITHSSLEQEVLAEIAPGRPVSLWPLMARHHGTKVAFRERRDICFLGGYRHPPNIDAVQYFCAEIMPLLRVAEPGLRFIIAGSNMPAEVEALAAPDVIIAGQVEDLQDLFDAVRVFACPLRVGAGVKGKVASAMAYGLPVVSTPVGVEGTTLSHGHDVLVAEAPADFAAQILAAYRDEALWHFLSKNGEAMVRRELSLDMGKRVLATTLEMAYAHKLGLQADG
jgi:glycosyltransferase involved in cell wall biosynthesis